MYGVISDPYRIGKYSVNGHLGYRLWFNNELLAEKGTFEECAKIAEEHEKSWLNNSSD
jgi:hypothetical protein